MTARLCREELPKVIVLRVWGSLGDGRRCFGAAMLRDALQDGVELEIGQTVPPLDARAQQHLAVLGHEVRGDEERKTASQHPVENTGSRRAGR